ncbi:MAG: hypothetical protein HYV38_02755 [Candidatus Levybacteria bacterium]|nr:hypothetical protein [Candidatus Levybacteria bacterium]MBI2420977.1 hypothetical protein [Candidatus Levybacteria bacterium]
MPRASRFRLEPKKFEEINYHLLLLISSLDKTDEIEKFLNGFLTKEEKIMLTKRLVLFMMLKRDYSSSVIQNALHVSYETVRSYQNQLSSKDSNFHIIIDRLIKRQETKELFQKIDEMLKPLKLAFDSKRNMKSRAKFASGDWH